MQVPVVYLEPGSAGAPGAPNASGGTAPPTPPSAGPNHARSASGNVNAVKVVGRTAGRTIQRKAIRGADANAARPPEPARSVSQLRAGIESPAGIGRTLQAGSNTPRPPVSGIAEAFALHTSPFTVVAAPLATDPASAADVPAGPARRGAVVPPSTSPPVVVVERVRPATPAARSASSGVPTAVPIELDRDAPALTPIGVPTVVERRAPDAPDGGSAPSSLPLAPVNGVGAHDAAMPRADDGWTSSWRGAVAANSSPTSAEQVVQQVPPVEPPAIDIDRLTDTVHARLLRRLAIERERRGVRR